MECQLLFFVFEAKSSWSRCFDESAFSTADESWSVVERGGYCNIPNDREMIVGETVENQLPIVGGSVQQHFLKINLNKFDVADYMILFVEIEGVGVQGVYPKRGYKRFQQFTARWQLLFFFSYLIQVEKNKTKKLWGKKKNNAPTAGTIASTGLRCPGVGPFQCRMTLRSDAVSQSFGSVVEPKRLGRKINKTNE
ncbi:hypothetical protein OUZ56_003862 [Daphnia magna]|uniref:Uncharacterized protein n=1 Tax=Daphnia magna TaxID=35525 RepID=A0ABQ9YN08_9CRUS|nr:hypothetical protein OUZ56_003862 [Daphnia magna]